MAARPMERSASRAIQPHDDLSRERRVSVGVESVAAPREKPEPRCERLHAIRNSRGRSSFLREGWSKNPLRISNSTKPDPLALLLCFVLLANDGYRLAP